MFEIDHEKIIAFVQANQSLAPLIVFLLAMGETIVVVSVFIPSTFVLFALGGLFAVSGVPLLPSLIAGGLGASFGFSAMYLLSAGMEGRILSLWPFRNYGETITRAAAFSRRWGAWGVVIGHFGGPLRVLIPIVAGISRMPPVPFMLANFAGAAAWITVFFAPGYLMVTSDSARMALEWARTAFSALQRSF